MTATAIQIAGALVSLLNLDPAFSQDFTARRHYVVDYDLPELNTLRVSVVPRSITLNNGTREKDWHEYAVDIAVQQRVQLEEDAEDPADLTQPDELMQLVEEISDVLRSRKRFDGLPGVLFHKAANDTIYDPKHLGDHRVFTSVLTVHYRVLR